ncbi:MAG: hypothetical protein WDM90_03740 [Ferruginibacter sp.]
MGEVNLFCSDKTGTLTEGVLKISGITGIDGKENATVKQLAFLNAFFETGFSNPMDDALKTMENINADGYEKTDEIPYDFIRKRLSVVVVKNNIHQLISKGLLIILWPFAIRYCLPMELQHHLQNIKKQSTTFI